MHSEPIGKRSCRVPDDLNAHIWWIWPALALCLTGKLNPVDDDADLRDDPVDRDQLGLIPACAGSGCQNETYWARPYRWHVSYEVIVCCFGRRPS